MHAQDAEAAPDDDGPAKERVDRDGEGRVVRHYKTREDKDEPRDRVVRVVAVGAEDEEEEGDGAAEHPHDAKADVLHVLVACDGRQEKKAHQTDYPDNEMHPAKSRPKLAQHVLGAVKDKGGPHAEVTKAVAQWGNPHHVSSTGVRQCDETKESLCVGQDEERLSVEQVRETNEFPDSRGPGLAPRFGRFQKQAEKALREERQQEGNLEEPGVDDGRKAERARN
ncbi:hypothetical protein BDK51DRAFT_49248 [Blyttiomyces helicus]|uniref:Uncharacterized protein n=1 Tax=Blyttiomyces helicus TaxID=388810 RepID=A0A4P9WR01_9FUNG|nr:hypothetical protein BDK51DRAFT_49248 [Blyttiomyces helicus]|eukprot:RKO93660.1 hypothetical protein BDK51DRAFT_49248 [Blyttiomyces helicus]